MDEEHRGLFDAIFTVNENRSDAAAIQDLVEVFTFLSILIITGRSLLEIPHSAPVISGMSCQGRGKLV